MVLKESFRPGQGARRMMTLKVFDDRLECTQPSLVGGGSTDAIMYEQIAQVVIHRGLRWSQLEVLNTGGGGFGIAGLNKKDADAAKAFIEEQIARVRSRGTTGSQQPGASLAEQMAQLTALRESGALTDDEFAAAKARLLNSGP